MLSFATEALVKRQFVYDDGIVEYRVYDCPSRTTIDTAKEVCEDDSGALAKPSSANVWDDIEGVHIFEVK